MKKAIWNGLSYHTQMLTSSLKPLVGASRVHSLWLGARGAYCFAPYKTFRSTVSFLRPLKVTKNKPSSCAALFSPFPLFRGYIKTLFWVGSISDPRSLLFAVTLICCYRIACRFFHRSWGTTFALKRRNFSRNGAFCRSRPTAAGYTVWCTKHWRRNPFSTGYRRCKIFSHS